MAENSPDKLISWFLKQAGFRALIRLFSTLISLLFIYQSTKIHIFEIIDNLFARYYSVVNFWSAAVTIGTIALATTIVIQMGIAMLGRLADT